MSNVDRAMQRLCVCESQLWDQMAGCNACYKDRGFPWGYWGPDDYLNSLSSTYCAATAVPTESLSSDLYRATSGAPEFSSATGPFSDPLGSSEAVSLYVRPSEHIDPK